MTEIMGSSENNPESNVSPGEIQYPSTTESPDISPTSQPGTDSSRGLTTGGPSPSKTVKYEPYPLEYASRQAMDVGINSLRTHVDDRVNMINGKISSMDELFKAKLETIEVKLNGQIEQLKTNIQILMEERKSKRDRRWDIKVVAISSVISLFVGACVTLAIEYWALPFFRR